MADAESLNRLGNDLADEGRWGDAEQAYARAATADPNWSAPWYNLGLLYKRQCRWAESLRAGERAVGLAPTDVDAWWNLGIAATALGHWATARRAWRGCGIDIPEGEGPLELNYGLVPLRLNPESSGEIVWAERIDPARGVIANVPLPESGFRRGDIVLHDGAPKGYRLLDGREVPVFDVLERLVASPRATYEAWVEARGPEDVEALAAMADAEEIALEDWSGSIRNLCKACSEGRPHEEHDRAGGEWERRRRLGISAESLEEVESLLRRWSREGAGRRVVEVRSGGEGE